MEGIDTQPHAWAADEHAARGEPAAPTLWEDFNAACEHCLPIVYRYTVSRIQEVDVAEDLVGDTFERALHAWPTFEHRSSTTTWLLGIARHVIGDYARRRPPPPVRLQALIGNLPDLQTTDPEHVAEQREKADRLGTALATLSEADREVLALRYAADLAHREIARILGVREVTVRVRVYRALRRLADLMRGMGED